MDRFAEMKAFCAVAALGGFSPAARQMDLSTSSVTRLVDALERRLGAVLLNRSTRSVTLTDRGRIYYEQALLVMEQLDAADDSVLDGGSELLGTLRVAAPVTFAAMYLAPVLTQLRARHPNLLLDLRLSDTAANLTDESIDVAVRIGSLEPHPNLIARPLAGHERVLCASPGYLEKRGTPQHPVDLAGHDCVQFRFADNRSIWRLRRDPATPVEDIPVHAVIQANNGELLRVLPDYQVNPTSMDVGLYALYQSNRRGSQKIRVFVDLLAGHLAGRDTAMHARSA
jgi:DNA-binding transcriptional LysR family regulator